MKKDTAIVKHQKQWWHCSDSQKQQVSLEHFISSNRENIQLMVFEKEI
jgi:hypothetical protein